MTEAIPKSVEKTHIPESSSSNDDRGLITYVQRIKLAVAVAVIKSTPRGMQPKDHAASLVKLFAGDVSCLEAKCQKLEQEVFALEQKLETVKMRDGIGGACPGIEGSNIDFFARERDFSPNLPEAPPTHISHENSIKDTVEFVRVFILLDSIRISGDANGSSSKQNALILKSISHLLVYLRSDEGLEMEFDIVRRSITEIHRLFDTHFGKLNCELVQICLNFVEELLVDIHQTLKINKVEHQHKRSSLIQMMAEHRSLTILILCRLLREITITSDFLESIFREDNAIFTPLLHAENIYYVLQSTEGVLDIVRRQKSALSALKIPDGLLREWGRMTAQSLSRLGTHFPMYCVYVWHLKTVMKSVFCVGFGDGVEGDEGLSEEEF